MTDYLTIVNSDNPISDRFPDKIRLLPFMTIEQKACKVEQRTLGAFMLLSSALRKKGIVIGIASAYRSITQQQQIFESFCHRYGEEYALSTVAKPGTSEHHTGLAIDISIKSGKKWIKENAELLIETETFSKIHEILPHYGFIVRYPAEKESITGYPYEPWHIRYVGKEAARKISSANITLEEYI